MTTGDVQYDPRDIEILEADKKLIQKTLSLLEFNLGELRNALRASAKMQKTGYDIDKMKSLDSQQQHYRDDIEAIIREFEEEVYA